MIRDYCPQTGYETHREDEAPQNDDTCPNCGTDHLPGLPCPDEEYTEDPDEVTPCTICGEPKPNREKCANPDCPEGPGETDTSSLEGIDPRSPLFGMAVAHLICGDGR